MRRREQGAGRRVPIIALTAHAMKGDRERCLEAGMDGYVTKPFQPAALWEAIRAVLPADRGIAVEGVFDRDDVLARLDGNEEMLQQVIEVFQNEAAQQLAAIRAAAQSGDAHALDRAAHSLKGSLAFFAAPAAVAPAVRLEAMGRSGDLAEARETLADLEREFASLCAPCAGGLPRGSMKIGMAADAAAFPPTFAGGTRGVRAARLPPSTRDAIPFAPHPPARLYFRTSARMFASLPAITASAITSSAAGRASSGFTSSLPFPSDASKRSGAGLSPSLSRTDKASHLPDGPTPNSITTPAAAFTTIMTRSPGIASSIVDT